MSELVAAFVGGLTVGGCLAGLFYRKALERADELLAEAQESLGRRLEER